MSRFDEFGHVTKMVEMSPLSQGQQKCPEFLVAFHLLQKQVICRKLWNRQMWVMMYMMICCSQIYWSSWMKINLAHLRSLGSPLYS